MFYLLLLCVYKGNDIIHDITSRQQYELRVDLEDFGGGRAYAQYSKFYVGPASSNYTLKIGGYRGTAGKYIRVLGP